MKKATTPSASRTARAIQKEIDHRTFIAQTDYLKLHTEEFALQPDLWTRYGASRGLVWKRLPFDKKVRPQVPKTQGLYAFVVHPCVEDLPPSSWLFYIGEVGATDSPARTFWKRYDEYLKELFHVTRPTLARLLTRYRGYISFYYCELDPSQEDIRALESKLITAAWPHANIKDFEVEYRQTRAAFK